MKKRKRYPSNKQTDGMLKMYWGRLPEGDPDFIFNWGPGCDNTDGHLLHMHFCYPRNYRDPTAKSLVDDLRARGYDIETIKFSIRNKQ